jgi:protein-S-isoprenylcysteine O-methyltransferase Ste14
MPQPTLLRLLRVLGLAAGLVIWILTFQWIAGDGPIPPPAGPVIVLVATLLPLPAVFLGRWALDRNPTVERTAWVTTIVHYAVAIPLGVSLIAGIAAARVWPCAYGGWLPLPCPDWPALVGLALVAISGIAALATVVNLALRGLGAPFAIALTRRLATDRLYAWTRNPMVLAGLALMVSLGVWLDSWWFIAWTVLAVAPTMLVFLKVYEERELELRFGEPYVDYKRRTAMLIPRPPRP